MSAMPPTDAPPVAGRRERVAQALAFAALMAALVGSLGPAERVRTTHAWPPENVQSAAPSRVWYTPLLLVRHRPEALRAVIPCAPAPALPQASSPVIVLATARRPERVGGLAVTREAGALVVQVGASRLAAARLPLDGDAGAECAYELLFDGSGWSLEGGHGRVALGGALETAPVVTGLFSELDLGAANAPSIEVRTHVHATRAAAHQKLAWLLAALTAAGALILVSTRPGASLSPWTRARRLARAALARAHPADAFVAVALVAWLVLSPAFFDDGWIYARERMYSSAGAFSTYYNLLATNLPLDYWVEWLHRWLADATSALVLLRLPSLACLAAAWVLARWIFARVQAGSSGESSVGLWALAAAFVIGAMAWGMTLRPEPVTGLLVVGVMACMVRFHERMTTGSVALAAVLVPLALTAHPAGVVSLAPVLVVSPSLVRWARSYPPAATAIGATACALLTLFLFLGSDVEQRVEDTKTVAAYPAISEEWRDEFARYSLLSHEPTGTPLRRAAVALLLLAVAAFLLRRRRNDESASWIPGAMLAVGLLMLLATPSKWPWHFGTLVGIGAVAVAAESERLRAAARSRGWSVWPFAVVGAAAIVGMWPWAIRGSWNALDLRTLDWEPDFEGALSLARIAVLVPVLLLAGTAAVALARRRTADLRSAPWQVASWTALVLALPPIAFTAVTLVADAAKTDGWTLARQNVEAIAGDPGCGLAEDLVVSVPGSLRPLSPEGARAPRLPGWVPPAPVESLARFALSPAPRGAGATPWLALPADRRFGLFVAGAPSTSESVWLESGRRRGGSIVRLRSDEVTRPFDGFSGTAPWRFLPAGDHPRPDPRARFVRLTARADVAPGSAIAVTGLVAYTTEALAPALSRPGSVSLVYPDVLPYFPCTQLPRLAGGIVEVPVRVVSTDALSLLSRDESSSFLGLLDLYELERTSVADSEERSEPLQVFEVEREIPGARLVEPDSVTFTS